MSSSTPQHGPQGQRHEPDREYPGSGYPPAQYPPAGSPVPGPTGQPWQQPAPAPKRRRWVHVIGYPLVGLVALGVGVSIGGAAAGDSNGSVGKDVVAASPAPAASEPAASGGSAKKPDGVYSYGDVVKFSDGSTLEATKPVKFRPSQYVESGDGTPVKVKVTFTNNSSKVFDPTLSSSTMSSAGEDAEAIFDSGKGIDLPENKVLPGKSLSWFVGFSPKSPAKTTLTVNVGFLDYDQVLFSNDS